MLSLKTAAAALNHSDALTYPPQSFRKVKGGWKAEGVARRRLSPLPSLSTEWEAASRTQLLPGRSGKVDKILLKQRGRRRNIPEIA